VDPRVNSVRSGNKPSGSCGLSTVRSNRFPDGTRRSFSRETQVVTGAGAIEKSAWRGTRCVERVWLPSRQSGLVEDATHYG